MAKGDSTGQQQSQNLQPQYGNMYGGPGGGYNGPANNFGRIMGNFAGAMGNLGGQMQQQQQNQLFQGMDPRLVSLFNQYGINPTGRGTGNSDIAYWNDKISAPGADANYYLGRLGSDFAGNGPDLANNNLSYSGNSGNLAGRYYQQPMMRRPMFGGGNQRMRPQMQQNRFQNYGNYSGGYSRQQPGQPPQYNYSTVQQPNPGPDTSGNP